jgi:hypothetical protein
MQKDWRLANGQAPMPEGGVDFSEDGVATLQVAYSRYDRPTLTQQRCDNRFQVLQVSATGTQFPAD